MTERNGLTAFLPGKGKCSILRYEGNGYYTLLTKRDQEMFVHKSRFIFTKEKEQ